MNDHFGAAIFDRPEQYSNTSPSKGYKFNLSGEQGIITGLGELSSDHYWITNIPFEVSKNFQLMGTTKLLAINYLRHKTDGIIDDLGLTNSVPSLKAATVTRVLKNTMQLASRHFGIDGVPAKGLSAGIASANITHVPDVPNELKEACGQSFQNWVKCEYSYDTNHVHYSVYLPRLRHCLNIIESGIPLGTFSLIHESQLPVSQQDRLNLCINHESPMLVKFTIDRVSQEISHLLNWSNGAPQRTGNKPTIRQNNQRLWACTNELKFLSEFADLKIHQIAISRDYLNKNLYPPFLKRKNNDFNFTNLNLFAISYSFGILAENYWTSLTRNIEGSISLTPTSAWIHASDRLITLRSAKILSDAGFAVKGYGFGRIDLGVYPSAINDLMKVCIQNQIMFPFAESIEIHNSINVQDTKSTDFNLKASLATANELEKYMAFDDALISKGL